MSEIEKLPTGVPGMDELLRGGLPAHRATLISGRSGVCKTLLSLQMGCNFARAGKRVLFLSAEERPDDLITSGAQLGFGIQELIDDDKLLIQDLTQSLAGPILITGNFDVAGLIHRINFLTDQNNSDIVIIDSVSALFSSTASQGHRNQFFQLVYALTLRGLTPIFTAEAPSDYGQIAALGLEDYVCDVVIQLRNVIDGKRRRRSVEIHKYRRSSHLKGEYPCALTRHGLSIFPLDASSERQETKSTDVARYSSGIDGLDEITGGGWLRDGLILVRGPTGSGKTIMAGHFATAGAKRGERVFYYGFEETRPLLIRNFGRLGLEPEKYLEDGSLKIVARFPEATSPEDMIIELRTVLIEHEPSLVVLDSISAIEHVLSYETFRQFIIGITSALRQHGRSALLVQAAPAHLKVDAGAPYLSTMADAIVQLSYDASTPAALTRRLRVFKLRGSAHDTSARKMQITSSGLKVFPSESAAE